jgi:hypothetical protein
VQAQAHRLRSLHLPLHVFRPRHQSLLLLPTLTPVHLLPLLQVLAIVDVLHPPHLLLLLQMLTPVDLPQPPHVLLLLQLLTPADLLRPPHLLLLLRMLNSEHLLHPPHLRCPQLQLQLQLWRQALPAQQAVASTGLYMHRCCP